MLIILENNQIPLPVNAMHFGKNLQEEVVVLDPW